MWSNFKFLHMKCVEKFMVLCRILCIFWQHNFLEKFVSFLAKGKAKKLVKTYLYKLKLPVVSHCISKKSLYYKGFEVSVNPLAPGIHLSDGKSQTSAHQIILITIFLSLKKDRDGHRFWFTVYRCTQNLSQDVIFKKFRILIKSGDGDLRPCIIRPLSVCELPVTKPFLSHLPPLLNPPHPTPILL